MKNISVIAVLFLLACGDTPEEAAPPATPEVEAAAPSAAETAATIAGELRASPGSEAAVLERHGLSADEFEALLYEVAADPELSKAYLGSLE